MKGVIRLARCVIAAKGANVMGFTYHREKSVGFTYHREKSENFRIIFHLLSANCKCIFCSWSNYRMLSCGGTVLMAAEVYFCALRDFAACLVSQTGGSVG